MLLQIRHPGADIRELRPEDDFIQFEGKRRLHKEPRRVLGVLRFGMQDVFLRLVDDPQLLLVAVAAVFEEVEDFP